jgi:hypothetical protein
MADQSAQEAMSILDEIKQKINDDEYKRLAEALAAINPNKDVTVEYPADTEGLTTVVTTSEYLHIRHLKRRLNNMTVRYTRETRKYLVQISDLSAEMLRLKKEWDEEEDDDEDDE